MSLFLNGKELPLINISIIHKQLKQITRMVKSNSGELVKMQQTRGKKVGKERHKEKKQIYRKNIFQSKF